MPSFLSRDMPDILLTIYIKLTGHIFIFIYLFISVFPLQEYIEMVNFLSSSSDWSNAVQLLIWCEASNNLNVVIPELISEGKREQVLMKKKKNHLR